MYEKKPEYYFKMQPKYMNESVENWNFKLYLKS